MANHILTGGFGGGARWIFFPRKAWRPLNFHYISYYLNVPRNSSLIYALFSTVWTIELYTVQELLFVLIPNDVVHCFRSEQCLLVWTGTCFLLQTHGPSHLEQNLSRAGNLITIPHTHENFCSPLQSTIQWFLDISQKKKNLLKALEEHECGGPTCDCVPHVSLSKLHLRFPLYFWNWIQIVVLLQSRSTSLNMPSYCSSGMWNQKHSCLNRFQAPSELRRHGSHTFEYFKNLSADLHFI